jgi:hypothetical protein
VQLNSRTNPALRRFPSNGGALRRSLTSPEDASLIEILDRILDRGIVVEPASRVRLISLELRGAPEHLVVDWRDSYF